MLMWEGAGRLKECMCVCVCVYDHRSAGGVCVELADSVRKRGSISTSNTSQKDMTALKLP